MTLKHLPSYVENLCAVIPDDESETTSLELQFKACKLQHVVTLMECLTDGVVVLSFDSLSVSVPFSD